MSSVKLSHARYGKQAIRVFRIVREDKWHTVVEYNVTALLEGEIDVAYVQFGILLVGRPTWHRIAVI